MHCFWTKIHYTSHKLRYLQRYKLRAMGYRIQGLSAMLRLRRRHRTAPK